MRLNAWHSKTTIIQVYAPANATTDNEKDDFYCQLQDVLDAVPAHDMVILMEDVNTIIGHDTSEWEDVMGTEVKRERTNKMEKDC